MSIEENKALVRRYFDEAPYHPDTCNDIFAPKILWHALNHTSQPNIISDPQSERAAYKRHESLWGGWSENIDEMIAEGDRVMVRWTFCGTHQAEYLGVPPSHQPVTFSGIYIFRIDAGRIAELWVLWDQMAEWQQLGLIPETKEILSQAEDGR
jgi:predicted ester cyclase